MCYMNISMFLSELQIYFTWPIKELCSAQIIVKLDVYLIGCMSLREDFLEINYNESVSHILMLVQWKTYGRFYS